MTDTLALFLFGAGAVFAALCGWLKCGRPLWALLAAACTAAGVLSGLVLGAGLDELLTRLLAVCAVSMAALLHGKEGGA